jgi:CO/xanthine dehydrogenase FAD-binding subunit
MKAGQPIAEVAALALRDIEPLADLHATAAYRRSVSEVLVRRALTEAAANAKDTE